jgi:hypothetical protein
MQLQQNIFDKGYLRNFMSDRMNTKTMPKLQNHELTRIATALGSLSQHHDLYNLLFEQPDHVVEPEFTPTGVHTKDLAAFVLLDHTLTRGYFAKSAATKSTSDTTNSQGVPLAFEGARRIYNKTYMSWLDNRDLSSISSAVRADIFLPAHLGSITIGPEGPTNTKWIGLISLLHFKIKFPLEVITQLREQVSNYLVSPGPRVVDPKLIDGDYGEYYNKCGNKLRSMILQGWIYSPVCRNADMITNIVDWDVPPAGPIFDGLVPIIDDISPLERFLNV